MYDDLQFNIEKVTVTAKSRTLKAQYCFEVPQPPPRQEDYLDQPAVNFQRAWDQHIINMMVHSIQNDPPNMSLIDTQPKTVCVRTVDGEVLWSRNGSES